MTVRELITKWGFKVEDSELKRFEKNLNNVKTAVKVIGGLAIGAAGSMFGMAQSTAKAGDNIAKTADRLGVGIEALQEFRFAADLAGVSSGELDTSLRFLSRNIAEASRGTGEAKDNFKRLGIQLKDVRTGQLRKTEDVLLDLAEAFKRNKDAGTNNADAMKILGRSGDKMINMLVQGRIAINAQRQELRELGLLTEEEARQAEKYIDAQTRLGRVFTGIGYIIGAKLVPVITKYTDKFREFILENKAFIKQKIDKALDLMAKAFKRLRAFVSATWESFKGLIKSIGGAENAVKMLVKAFAVFIGLKLVAAIGGIVQSFFKLLWAMRKVKVMATLTNIAVAAIPLAVGAAFLAAGIIVQDFFAFLRGDKTLIGGILHKFGFDVGKTRTQVKAGIDFIKNLGKNLFGDIEKEARIFFAMVEDSFTLLKKDLESLAVWISEAFDNALPSIESFFQGIKTEINDIIRDIERIPEAIKKPFVEMGESIKKSLTFDLPFSKEPEKKVLPKDIFSLSGVVTKTPALVTTTPRIGGSSTYNINSPITVTIPQGTTPEKIAPIIKESFRESLGEVLRETNRQTAPAHD
jgi:hypothetical protein